MTAEYEIVRRLRAEPYWVGGSQQQSEGEASDAPFEAADAIEALAAALEFVDDYFDCEIAIVKDALAKLKGDDNG